MATTMEDLTEDLVVMILSRVPLTSLGPVRCTCKKWNTLSKNQIFGKTKNQFLGFMVMDSRVCSLRFEGDDLSIKQVSVLNQMEVTKAYHCDGLLLCVLNVQWRLLVWNPYLGQRRWIRLIFDKYDRFALGYDNKGKHKILKICINRVYRCAIYEFGSNSWRDLDVTLKWGFRKNLRVVNLKGNAYFYVYEKIITEGGETKTIDFLLCFDFTSESFGPRLSLPFHSSVNETVTLSCVRDEKLAVLCQRRKTCEIMEIWVTSKIDHNEILWTKYLEVDMKLLTGFPIDPYAGSFFIDEEKKVAVVFDLEGSELRKTYSCQIVHIIGQDGYFKSINVGKAPNEDIFGCPILPFCCSSYVPSLVRFE